RLRQVAEAVDRRRVVMRESDLAGAGDQGREAEREDEAAGHDHARELRQDTYRPTHSPPSRDAFFDFIIGSPPRVGKRPVTEVALDRAGWTRVQPGAGARVDSRRRGESTTMAPYLC